MNEQNIEFWIAELAKADAALERKRKEIEELELYQANVQALISELETD